MLRWHKKREVLSHLPFFIVSAILLARQSAKTLVEAINTAASVNNTLLTSVEWVALVTYVQVDVFT